MLIRASDNLRQNGEVLPQYIAEIVKHSARGKTITTKSDWRKLNCSVHSLHEFARVNV